MLGEYPDGNFLVSSNLPIIIPTVQPNIPADILDRRPDIKSAIAKAKAAAYRTAESISSYLPGLI